MMEYLRSKPFTTKKVILISIDSLRADRLSPSCMPKLHRLLSKGYKFQRAYSNFPYTGAAHASMFTSLYACNHGKTDNGWVLPSHFFSVAQLLQRANVETAAVVSAAPLRKEQSGFDRGFTIYIQDERQERRLQWLWVRFSSRMLKQGLPDILLTQPYLTLDGVLRRAQGLIHEAASGEKRFFLFIHLMDLHEPYSLFRVQREGFSIWE